MSVCTLQVKHVNLMLILIASVFAVVILLLLYRRMKINGAFSTLNGMNSPRFVLYWSCLLVYAEHCPAFCLVGYCIACHITLTVTV